LCQICTGHIFLPKGIGFYVLRLSTFADSRYYFRGANTAVLKPENEGAASDSDESSGEEVGPLESQVGHVHGNTAGESEKSPVPKLDGEANDNDINSFEDMLDYAPMDDQVRSL
jgi:hypothetical protein